MINPVTTINGLLGNVTLIQGSNITITPSGNSITIASTGGGGSVTVFNVQTYGAVGDGTTDDKTDINLAIAALNSAGGGILYFPFTANGYKVSATLTTITAPFEVRGDGSGAYDPSTSTYTYLSRINFTSNNTALFNITALKGKFQSIALVNTAGTTPVSGSAAISTTSSDKGQRVDYNDVFVKGFYIGFDVQVGWNWVMHACQVWDPIQYAVKIQNTVDPDYGDMAVTDCTFVAGPDTLGDSTNKGMAVYQTSGGGLKFCNNKINTLGTAKWYWGVGIVFSGTTASGDFLISNNSIEGCHNAGIAATANDTSVMNSVVITGNQIYTFDSGATGIFMGGNSTNKLQRPTVTGNTGYNNTGVGSPSSNPFLYFYDTAYMLAGNTCDGSYTGCYGNIAGNTSPINFGQA